MPLSEKKKKAVMIWQGVCLFECATSLPVNMTSVEKYTHFAIIRYVDTPSILIPGGQMSL